MRSTEHKLGREFIEEVERFVAGNTKIKEALELARAVHSEDKRESTGEPYINHCLSVAGILWSWGGDEDEIIAGLLHDTVEDHPEKISIEQISDTFGKRVAHLVDGATKLHLGERSDFETLRKVTKESMIEAGVALIKLADRLHNMMTLEGLSEERQRRLARETIEFYVPLAESFGLWIVKRELADLAYQYYDPERYLQIKSVVDEDPRLGEEFIVGREKELALLFELADLDIKIEHRFGGYFQTAYKQKQSAMKADGRPKSFSEITDLLSIRVLVDGDEDARDCYQAMGIVRMFFGKLLLKQRHDDFLSEPAVNGYSAIHDSYKFPEGVVEIAFTTESRENFNNWGVAMVDRETMSGHPEIYARKLIFTPKKELVILEPTARAIDVAYKISPQLGRRAVAVRIDGRICELTAAVENASSVEILTDVRQTGPRPEWLEFCNSETRRSIEQQLAEAERDMEIVRGKEIITEKVLKERGLLDLTDLSESIVDRLLIDLGCWYGVENLYYKVAYGLDLDVVRSHLDELGIVRGRYTTVRVRGKNRIGISEKIAGIVAKNNGDARKKVETVDEDERFDIRILMTIGYIDKKKMETELLRSFDNCEVV